MPTVNLSVRYRPVRIGFLVRDGSIEDCVKAAGINTLLWGGVCNPLIPVSAAAKFSNQLIKVFCVDVLNGVSNSPEIDKLIADNPYLRNPHHYNNDILHEDWKTKQNVISYLDVLNVIDACWERDIQHSTKSFKSNCSLIRWDSTDPLANLFALQFGYYPSLNLLHDFEKAFLLGLKASEITIPKDGDLAADIAENISPMCLTRLELSGHGGGWRLDDGIYIGDATNFDDLVSYWNLRSAGHRIKFLPIEHANRLKAYVSAYLEQLDKRESPNPNIEDCIAVHYRQENENSAKILIEEFKTKKKKVLCSADKDIWNGLNVKPSSYHFGWKRILATQDEYFGKPVVNFGLPEKDFLADRPSRPDAELASQHLAVSLDFFSDIDILGYTLRPPYIRELNEFYSREITMDPWRLRVEADGIAILKDAGDESVSLYPLPHQDLIERVFTLAGVRAGRSQPGLLAAQIIKNMREYSPLDACRVFKVRGARTLISTLRPSDSITWNEAIKIIGTEHFDKFKGLYIVSREKRELEPSDVLNFLLKKKILAPHLRLWERICHRRHKFKCIQCGLESTILMAAFEGNWRCPYCEHDQYLPQHIGERFSRKDMWLFKKSGLFARDNNQEGAIPVILTLLTLLRILETRGFIYSTSLNLHSEMPCETDICVLQYQRGEEIEIGIGECKGRGGITAQDVQNLKAVRNKLEAIGLSCHLIFANTKDMFTTKEIDIFKTLQAEQVPVVLFTNRELEPYHPYWEDEGKEKLPFPYAMTLKELAVNSSFRYIPRLGSPPASKNIPPLQVS